MARGGRMLASFSQTVRIRDAIVNQLPNVQDLMREQLTALVAQPWTC
jgi:hypothetical protein